MIADVIFPAFAAPYFSPLLLPIAGAAAIGTELFVFWRYNRAVPFNRLLSRVILANLVSWFVGMIIAFLLPSGLGTTPVPSRGGHISIVTTGPHWKTLAIIAFFLACALSIVIEYCGRNWIAGIGAVLLGVVYAAAVTFLAALFTGAGHGWMSGCVSGFALILVPLASCAWVFRGTRGGRALAISTLVSACAVDTYLVLATQSEGFYHVGRVWSAMPLLLLGWLVLWLAWQIALASLVFLCFPIHPQRPTVNCSPRPARRCGQPLPAPMPRFTL